MFMAQTESTVRKVVDIRAVYYLLACIVRWFSDFFPL